MAESKETQEEKLIDAMHAAEQEAETSGGRTKGAARRAVTFVVTLLLCFVVAFIMMLQTTLREVKKSSQEAEVMIDSIADNLLVNSGYENSIVARYMNAYQSEINVIHHVLSDYNIQNFTEEDRLQAVAYIEKMRSTSESREFYVTDREGNLILASSKYWLGRNLVELGEFSKEELDALITKADVAQRSSNESPEEDILDCVVVQQYEGEGYFFARRLEDSNGEEIDAYLILGYDADVVNQGRQLSIDKTLMAQTAYGTSNLVNIYLLNEETGETLFDSRGDLNQTPFTLNLDVPEDGSLGYRGTLEFEGEDIEHDAYAREITVQGMGDLLLIACYGFDDVTAEGMINVLSAMVVCIIALLIISILLLIYCSYASHSSVKFSKFVFVTIGTIIISIAAFGIVAHFAVSLMLLTQNTNSAIHMNQLLREQECSIQESSEGIDDYFKELDLNSVALVANDLEYSGAKLIDENAVPHVYVEGNNAGAYAVLTDTFNNEMTCYGGAKVLADKLSVLNASRIYLLNDRGYAIASSNDEEWSYNANQQSDRDEIRDVLYGKERYRYKYITDEYGRSVGLHIDYPITLYAVSDGNGTTCYLTYRQYQDALKQYQAKGETDEPEPMALRGVLSVEIDGVPAAVQTLEESYDNLYEQVTRPKQASVATYDKDKNMTGQYAAGSLAEEDIMTLQLPEDIGEHSTYNVFRKVGSEESLVHTDTYYLTNDATGTVTVDQYRSIIMATDDVFASRSELTKMYIIDAAVMFLFLGLFLFIRYYKPVKKREEKALAILQKQIEEAAAAEVAAAEAAAAAQAAEAAAPAPTAAAPAPGTAPQIAPQGAPAGKPKAAPSAGLQPAESEVSASTVQPVTAEELLHKNSILGRLKKIDLQKAFSRTDTTAMLLIQIILMFTAAMIITGFFGETSDGESALFTNFYGNEWERCFNLYNVIACIALFAEILVVLSFLKKLVSIFFIPLGPKVETYAKLGLSTMKYLLMFGGLFYSAYLLGVEVGKIATAATVVAGVVAANSKQIGDDLVTGVSIFTEGAFMIGDRVQIDAFTGTIKEVGLRNCILMNDQGMLKTVPNSRMTSAIRLTER